MRMTPGPPRWDGAAAQVFAPCAVAASYVLSVFMETGGHWSIALRPLIVAVVVAGGIELLLLLVIRRMGGASVLATLAVLLLTQHPMVAFMVGYLAFVALAGWWFVRVRKVWARRPPAAVPVAIMSWSLLLVSVAAVLVTGSIPWTDIATQSHAERGASDRRLPSIFVILLDGYPRADTLAETYHYDNSPFLAQLHSLGFDLYPDSHTDYDQTRLSLVSMLSGDVEAGLRYAGVDQKREMRRLMSTAPALDELRLAGYELVTVRSPIVHVSGSGWDRIIDSGEVNDLEVVLLSRLRTGSLFRDWILQQQRDRIVATLQSARSLASEHDELVALVHVLSPHPPFLFAADGSAADPSSCWPTCGLYSSSVDRHPLGLNGYVAAMAGQISALNQMVLDTVAQIIEADPKTVVVVMGDHGTRYSDGDQNERYANLFVARTPGHHSMFGVAPTPAALFHRLLATYRADGA